ncbi:rCG22938 [Rattus norvegicus]|uniref:RCG22938 n=1 Tax=Rattus norvegicus TaxID=10116 RepID=A6KB75_RAT|nr:rCG22938 [Rattus norvegicus]
MAFWLVPLQICSQHCTHKSFCKCVLDHSYCYRSVYLCPASSMVSESLNCESGQESGCWSLDICSAPYLATFSLLDYSKRCKREHVLYM